jgi:serine/threonine protein kinase
VYLGEHQYLERPAAIKVLHVRMEAAQQESFRREARTIAQLQHPHIIHVYDFGIESQTPYLVMEYTAGGTLRQRHPKGTRLGFEQIITYVKQIASALDYAHQQHVIHRDIKPENLLLTPKQEVILSDFGIAVVQQTLDSLSTQNPAGTPRYMAPEQIQRHPCPASDQYALGVMVYEWLTGEAPFSGSLYEVFSQHLHAPPSGLCARIPGLPSAVEDAVMGELAKDPRHRFPTMQDFSTVLDEAFFATQPLLLSTSIVHEEHEESTRPLAPVIAGPASSLSRQQSSDEDTHPRLGTVPRIQPVQEGERHVFPHPVVESQNNSRLTRSSVTQTNRQRLLRRVRSFWIDGVLSHSLHGAALLALGLEEQPDAVAHPWHLVVEQPETEPCPLPEGTRITQVYDQAEGELLLLGAPGAGKTTLLLELAHDLLTRAEHDENHPLPVVFNLSSWGEKQQSLTDWLVEELNEKYQVPRKLAQTLIETEQVLPLLDGLDEVAVTARTQCIETINSYRRESGTPLVVCSRMADYLAERGRVLLESAVLIQPLTSEQIELALQMAGPAFSGIRTALQQQPAVRELVTTPLMLSILTLTYQGKPVEDLLRAPAFQEQQRQIFEQYVSSMLTRRGPLTTGTPQQVVRWLSYLARQMRKRNQTIFYLERMQPDWLPSKRQSQYLWSLKTVIGLLTGLIIGPVTGIVMVPTDFEQFIGLVVRIAAGLFAGLVAGIVVGQFTGSLQPHFFWTRSGQKKRGSPVLTFLHMELKLCSNIF